MVVIIKKFILLRQQNKSNINIDAKKGAG